MMNSNLFLFIILNLLSAVSNLLPINGYDGYRIMDASFSLIMRDVKKKDSLLILISLFLTSSAVFFSLYLILRFGEGYWLFALFFLSLLTSAKKIQIST